MKILLGSKEYLKAINTDFEIRFNIENNNNIYQYPDIYKVVDELDQFAVERNSSFDYLLYGKLEVLSDVVTANAFDLNQTNYTISVGYIDRIIPVESDMYDIEAVTADYITIGDDIAQMDDIVLIYNSGTFVVNRVLERVDLGEGDFNLKLDSMTGITTSSKLVASVSSYKRYFNELISTNYLKIYNSAYSTNIFGDQIFQYNTFNNINVENLMDNLNNPITQLIMRFKPTYDYKQYYDRDLTVELHDDLLIDLVSYDLNQLSYEVISQVTNVTVLTDIAFYITPYISFDIKAQSDVVTNTNTNNLFTLPGYGFSFNNGDIVYREVLDIGAFEGTVGVDYPFINKLHYLYNDIKFFVRRIIPLPGTYDSVSAIDGDVYASDLVNNDVTTKRLC